MGFFSGIVHAIGGAANSVEDFFGGNNKKKQQDQQKQQNQQKAPAQAPTIFNSPPSQNNGPNDIPINNGGYNPNALNLTLLNKSGGVTPPAPPAPDTLKKVNPAVADIQKIMSAPTPSKPAGPSVASTVGNALISPFKPLGQGIARLLPGGQNDIKANEAAQVQADKNMKIYSDLHKAGKTTNDQYSKQLLSLSQDNQAIGREATRIGKTADRSQVVGSALATASAPFLGAANIGETLLAKAGVGAGIGALEGANNELTSNADPTLKGAAIQTALGAAGGGVLPVIGAGAGKLVKALRPGRAAPAVTQAVDNEITPGLKSVNPNGQADAAAHVRNNTVGEKPAPAPIEPVLGPNGEVVPQVSAEAPNATQPVVHTADPARTELTNQANDVNVPAYQRTAAKNQLAAMDAAEEEAQAKALGVADGKLETPAYERRGKTLPSEAPPSIESVNDGLHTAAEQAAKDPANAALINDAFNKTGSSNPLSLLMHSLSSTTDKATVRSLVQQLVPDAEGNTLNRAVNAITGADNQAEVAQALTEASTKAKTPVGPLGEVSTAEAPKPAVKAASDAGPSTADTAPQAQETAPVPQKQAKPATELAQPQRAESPVKTPETATPSTASKVENSSSDPIVAQPKAEVKPNDIPKIETPAGNKEADVAPLSHDAVVKSLGSEAKPLNAKYAKRNTVNLDEQKQQAEAALANSSSDDIVKMFGSVPSDAMITDSNSLAVARAALKKLYDSPRDEAAQQTASNILDAMDGIKSKSGQVLRAAQEDFDTMPVPMKVRYIMNKIDSANKDVAGYEPLRGGEATRVSAIDAILTDKLRVTEDLTKKISSLQGKAEDAISSLKKGEATDIDRGKLVSELKTAERQLREANGETVKYFNSVIPGRSNAQKALVDFPKRMMLASGTSRLNDVVTTGANVLHLGVENVVQSGLAKATNLVSRALGKGTTVTDGGRGFKQFLQGNASGLKESAGEFKGKQYNGDLQKALRSTAGEGRSNLQPTQGKIGRIIQASTEFATRATEGVQDQKVYQVAYKEAANTVKPEFRKAYAELRAAVPSAAMKEHGEQLHLEMSNLNDNAVTRGLTKVAQAIDGKSAVGGVIKNQIIPFTSFLGGNIYNTVTKKNVVASFVHLADSALVHKDAEEFIRNLAKTATTGAETYGLGYLLSQHGIITNQDANGYNDGGAYFHIGDRYIPANLAGFFAPSVILGNTAYNATHPAKDSNAVKEVTKGIENLGKSINIAGALGADNTVTRSVAATNKKGGGGLADGAATFGAGVAGQFIPSGTSDVNAVLNQTKLNPTHEAADTKVVNPNSKSGLAKDVPKSALNSVLNKVPLESQRMPRKTNQASADILDKITKGNRETSGALKVKADAKVVTDSVSASEKAGIPDIRTKYSNGDSFDLAVENRIENKKYDQAIAGLQTKLSKEQSSPNPTDTKIAPIKKLISQTQVLKEGNYDPKIRKDYSKLSVSEWRNLGDSKSDTYDLPRYQKIYEYDTKLAAKGASDNPNDETQNKYTAKAPGKGRGGRSSAESAAATLIKDNKIGSLTQLQGTSLATLTPKKITSTIAPLQKILPSDLVKKRNISVATVKA